jgi:acyl-coenzyme A synthetase/AMP-(fatty) acid ligase
MTNLASLLESHPFTDDEELLITVDRAVTAGEARQQAGAFAAELQARGVQPGQAVIAQRPNGPEAVEAMMGTWLARAVYVPAGVRQPQAELDAAAAIIRPAAFVGPHGIERSPVNPATYETDVAFVTWSSGTTGRPKAILHGHGAYLELLDRVLGPLRGQRSDDQAQPARSRRPAPNLIPVSLALNAGIYNTLFGLRAGAALVIMESFETAMFAELVRRFEIRSTVLPPAAMTMLASDPHVVDLSPLRYVRSITAPLSPLAARAFTEKFRVTVLNGYGLAEIGEVIGWTAADARAHPDKVGAAGRPHPGVDVKIVRESGKAVTTDEPGELLVRSPRMAAGYAGDERLDERIDPDGFVRTGDLAHCDADGFIWIEGRLDDVINRGGNKVFPEQVEDVIRLSPRVQDAAVVAKSDERLGQVPVAFVVGEASPAELEALCRQHLIAFKVPVAFHPITELPRNEVGKVLRRVLAARRASRAPSAPHAGPG